MALATSLVSYYKLEDTSDSVGGNTLTNTGSATFTTGKILNGVDFGSSNSTKYLSIDSALGMTGATAKSYSFWTKINTAPSSGVSYVLFRHIYGGAADGNYANVMYTNNSGTFEVRMPTSPGSMIVTQTLTVGTWYHFVVVVPASNTGNITCYLNGTSLGTTANWSQNYALTTRLVLGGDHTFSSLSSAMLDEFGIWSRALTADEVSQLFNSGRGNAYPLTDTPSLYGGVAYYKLDESSGNAADSVGGNTLTNNNTVTYSTGKINNGADFGASNASKYFSNASQLGLSKNNARSFSMWVNVTTAPPSGNLMSLFSLTYQTGAVGYDVYYWNNSGTLTIKVGRWRDTIDDPTQIVTQTLTVGTWYHLTYTFSGTAEVLYLNGSQIATNSPTIGDGSGTSLANATNIGRNTTYSRYFAGLLDEVGIWSRALSSTEVTALYNTGTGIQYPWAALNYILTAAYATFALTGQTAALRQGVRMIAAMGSYVLTGFNAGLSMVGWKSQSKSSSSWSTQSKSSSTWTSQNKS